MQRKPLLVFDQIDEMVIECGCVSQTTLRLSHRLSGSNTGDSARPFR